MREYGQVQTAFWTSPKVKSFSEDGRTLAIYLLTSPHSNGLGCFYLPFGYVVEDLKWKSERVSKGFTELFRKGFLSYCEDTCYVLIPHFLKWNPVVNENVAKARRKEFSLIPEKASIYNELCFRILEYGSHLSEEFETLLKRYGKGFETVSKQYPDPDPDPDPEKDPYPDTSKKVPPKRHTQFKKPTLSEVKEYCEEKKYTFDPEAFWAFYESKGWMVGKNKMKSWHSACITWQKKEPKKSIGQMTEKEQEEYYGSIPDDWREQLFGEEEAKKMREEEKQAKGGAE